MCAIGSDVQAPSMAGHVPHDHSIYNELFYTETAEKRHAKTKYKF
jgi:hypothetical protein